MARLNSRRCAEFAAHPVGICRLIVPTGGGKTLSSLRFAIRYAMRPENGIEKIVYTAPFMSILEQNSQDFREISGAENFLEIYVSTPLEECEKRDVKGLYAKARRGEIKNFTGISAPFEAPERPALSLDTSKLSLEESVNTLLELVLPTVGKKGEKI